MNFQTLLLNIKLGLFHIALAKDHENTQYRFAL